jgi:two-component system response regulator TtrR
MPREHTAEAVFHKDATIYVVDNDPSTAESVRGLVQSMGLRCEGYTSGFEFLEHFDEERPGCLICELRILDISGLQIQRRLAGQGARLPVLFLTAHATVPTVVRVMQEGAISVLEKPADDQALWECIQRGLRVDAERHEARDRKLDVKARLAMLSRAEREVFQWVLAGKTNKQISRLQNVALRTVELRRSNMMRKLGATSSGDLLEIALALNGCSAPLWRNRVGPYWEAQRDGPARDRATDGATEGLTGPDLPRAVLAVESF